VFSGPRHPYTEALFEALPEMALHATPAGPRSLYSIPGRPPDLDSRVPGCQFAPRCRRARDFCTTREPGLDGDHPGHLYACFFPAGQVSPAGRPDAPPPVSAWARPATGVPASAPAGSPDRPLLRVSGLVKSYPVTSGALVPRKVGEVSAVAGVSFDIAAGQTFGLVGESGCGKTTIARLLVGLERASAGSITYRGTDLTADGGRKRGQRQKSQRQNSLGIQLMFQDPYGSLDPRMRVEAILREPLVIQKAGRKRAHWRTVARLLDEVGLPADAAGRFPREFSGGQRQRLALARALILQPDLIVADEPVSALDVSVQAQILNLMRKLQRQYGLSYLFISHDLSVIRYMADVIGVMYLGKLVETGSAETVCTSPAHPYTRGLIDAVPMVALSHARGLAGAGIGGEPPPATSPPSGCRFRTRCPLAREICAAEEPPLAPATAPGQQVACHFPLDAGPPPGALVTTGQLVMAGIGAESA
jgi:peptide/nickel transport system ATP-binding protein